MTFEEQQALLDLAAFIKWCLQHDKPYMWCLGNVGHDIAIMVHKEDGLSPRSTGYTKRI